ncbi:39S ribosomal protein L46 [Schistosoma japonicum]|uniref:39S ribosomal protein L46 n=1 Tax=Schistosoma japonicum TaxID=6182 RepID=A0A4Z2CKG7_SCHJA|nr:39S ribosomal protein L46 [Schistosoma japonicum]
MSRPLVSLKDFKNWNIFSGLCIRRPVVIAPELTSLEKQVASLYKKMEFERSHLSAHELRHEIETKNISNALSKGVSTNTQESLITARETELMWELDAEKYKPAERLTAFCIYNPFKFLNLKSLLVFYYCGIWSFHICVKFQQILLITIIVYGRLR